MKNIEVYTINNCGFCEAAKTLLKNLDLDFKEINIAEDDDQKIALLERTGHRTLPQIFIDGQFIGGYNELKAFLKRA